MSTRVLVVDFAIGRLLSLGNDGLFGREGQPFGLASVLPAFVCGNGLEPVRICSGFDSIVGLYDDPQRRRKRDDVSEVEEFSSDELVWSGCGSDVTLNVKSELRSSTPSESTMLTLFERKLSVVWRKCSSS